MNNPVSIDEAHAHLLYGLVCAHKPTSVLEFGFGGGRSAQAIIDGIEFNTPGQNCLFIVDNWADWSGVMPQEAKDFRQTHEGRVMFIEMSEERFVHRADPYPMQFEFIFSDADHCHAQEWFQRTYDDLLAPGGILCYHDVCNFPNLWEIVEACKRQGLRYVVFNRESLPDEHCVRGILCIFKPVE